MADDMDDRCRGFRRQPGRHSATTMLGCGVRRNPVLALTAGRQTVLPPSLVTEDVTYDVFLSYHAPEREAVSWLADQLEQARLRPWFDQREILAGEPWMQRIEAGLAQSQAIAVIIGPSGMGPWQRQEASVALRLALPGRGTKRVIPVLLPGADRHGLPYLLDSLAWVEFREQRDDHALQRLITGLRGRPTCEAGATILELDPHNTALVRQRA